MPRYAIVDNIAGGVVLYTAINDFNPGGNWVQSDTANIGDSWNGSVFTAPTATAAAYGAALKRVVHAIMEQRLADGCTVGGVRQDTRGAAIARASLKRQHPPGGSRMSVGKDGVVTENAAQMNARLSAIDTYLDGVETYAAGRISAIDTEIGNDDVSALETIAAGLSSGWPSDAIS